MFWKYNTNSSSVIEALLGNKDVTLEEVMDAEDIINECRAQNRNLIDYLVKPEVIEELVTYTIKEPSHLIEAHLRYKYPNVACELLTCDVPAINERLASDKFILDMLYSFLECEPPLNPLLASYFSKIMSALIAKKNEMVLDFLKAKDTFISLLLKHLGTSAIMDLTLKLMTQVEGVEIRQNNLNWLDSQRIIQNLVCLLNPKVETERHYYVAQLLCDFIRIARDTQRNSTERADPDPLLNTLESTETVSLLLDNILEDKNESAIVGGIQVLLALLDVNQSSIPKFNPLNNYNSNINDEANDIEQINEKIIFNTIEAIKSRLTDFHNLLLDPPKKLSIDTTVGVLDPPLGNTRLQIARLFSSLTEKMSEELVQEIISLGTFQVLLDLFFKYPWNNFLHAQVEKCLINALFAGMKKEIVGDNALCKHLLINCKLIERFLNAWKENDENQSKENKVRQGYMGHVIRIVRKIDCVLSSSTSLEQFIKDNLPEVAKSWEEFKTTLDETIMTQETLLGGAHHPVDDNDDYSDIPFPQSSALQQQAFSQYQMHHLTSPYIDSGFNDDAFNDGDDTLQTIDHRTEMAHFDLTRDELVQQSELFKKLCAQNINPFDDSDDQIFDEKENTFQTVIEKLGDRNDGVCSSDSDDDSPTADDNMDVDAWIAAKSEEIVKSPSPLASHDPWGIGDSPNSESVVGGWADFSSATFDTNFNEAFGSPQKEQLENSMPVNENDIIVESIEINKTEILDSEIGSKNVTNSSIENVAQEIKSNVDNTKIVEIQSAAGDQGGDSILIQKKETCPVNEPSKSTDEITSEIVEPKSTEKDKPENENV